MSSNESNASRRAFFLRGGAIMGAGVASTAGAAAILAGDKSTPDDQLESMTECEAIRKLHLEFATVMEAQNYDIAADLFADQANLQLSGVGASGRRAIEQLFTEQYRHQKAAVMHSAYRQRNQADTVTLGEDRQQATATFHLDVALSTPLDGDSTVAQMARLQGQVGTRHWESGRLEARYVKTQGRWKIASLKYVAA